MSLNNTIQGYTNKKREHDGKNTLWLPGTDHASIATETKASALSSENINKEIEEKIS